MKFFNAAFERLERKFGNLTTKNTVLKKEMIGLKSSMQFHFDKSNKKVLQVKTKVSQVYFVNDGNIKTSIDDH